MRAHSSPKNLAAKYTARRLINTPAKINGPCSDSAKDSESCSANCSETGATSGTVANKFRGQKLNAFTKLTKLVATHGIGLMIQLTKLIQFTLLHTFTWLPPL